MLKRFIAIWISVPLILVAAFCLGLAIGGSSNTDAKPAPTSTVSATPNDNSEISTLGEFDPGYEIDPEYPLARSSGELPLIKLAVKSCDRIDSEGASLEVTKDDGSKIRALISPRSAMPKEVGVPQGFYIEAKGTIEMFVPLTMCLIRDQNRSLTKKPGDSNLVGYEHVINTSKGFNWTWHGHVQSVELSNTYLASTDGEYLDEEANAAGNHLNYKITYGLSPIELTEVKKLMSDYVTN
jgi:hypothetical protein